MTVSVSLCFEFGVRDATRVNLQETNLSFVHRLDRHTNNVQPNYDAEYNLNTSSDLNYRFEIESCCNLTGNPRDLHVTQAGGFGFFLDTRGRVRFLAFRDVESQCILDGFAYRLMLPVHVGARF